MIRTRIIMVLGLALGILSLASAALAGPIITVSPTAAGPIACDDTQTFNIHYNPNDYLGELGSFNITLANGVGDYAIFDDSNGSSDIARMDWAGSFFNSESDGPYEISVGGATFDGDPIAPETEADLFSITLHGADTGIGELHLVGVSLFNEAGQAIAADTAPGLLATLEVDCTPPDVPVMDAEPTYTAGLSNTVSWSSVADATEYKVRCSNGDESLWISDLSYEFDGLEHNTEYCYDVMARDIVGNESDYSDTVCSTQDAVNPESAAGPLDPAYATWNIDVPYTASDDMSGVQYVQLMYNVDGGAFEAYGTTFAPAINPIPFTATVDGDYLFYTVATDNAGNAEVNPEADPVATTLDTTAPDAPEMADLDPFTQGDAVATSWTTIADATEYQVRAFDGSGYLYSGWISDTFFTFTPLADDTEYCFDVQARDGLGNVGMYSGAVCTIMDANLPESHIIAPTTGYITGVPFDFDVFFADQTSGVDVVRLFYNLNTTTWVQYEGDFSPGPITFDPPEDGIYEFYTIAVDAVGNVETAPLDADAELNVDTDGPTGTMVINGGDPYTMEVNVTINSAMVDANGVIAMAFSTDGGATWTAMEPYAEEKYPLPLAPVGDGEKTVIGRYWDGTGQYTDITDTIILDTTAPEPATVPWGTGVVSGHGAVNLAWTEDDVDGDLATIEIWGTLWDDVHDAVGTSTYPEYDDTGVWGAPGAPISGNYALITDINADADWALLGEVPVGTMTFVHTEEAPWARAAYGYLLFAKDNAGNYSQASTQWPRQQVNYVLGDFDEDGVIDIIHDVTEFAVAFGADEGIHPAYDPIYDIGPLSGNVPDTDNDIDFEDLMVLSGSFNAQGAGKAAYGDPETPALTWFAEDENTWVLGLVDPCNSVKGINLACALPENVTIDYSLGKALEGDSGYFLANDMGNGLDLGFAVLGNNMVLAGTGEILRVTTSEPIDLSKATIHVRNAGNEEMEYDLTAEPLVVMPTAYMLGNNYPNPFNPETTIKFALPEAQDVKLEIFDIKGYRVKVLVNESMEAGNHSVMWNGRDQGGRMVASGAYFYRIQAGPLNKTHRMLLVK